jgi:micrococcal nuclease
MKHLTIVSFVLCALASLPVSAAHSRSYNVRVDHIVDGDTGVFVIDEPGLPSRKIKVRLAGVDAPEVKRSRSTPGQPFGLDAKRFLEEQTDYRLLQLTVLREEPRKGYVVGVIEYWILDQKFMVNAELVRSGLADVYEPTLGALPADMQRAFDVAQNEARNAKLGIWSLASRERPADYRKRLAAD